MRDGLWGPIEFSRWREVSHLAGRLATEEDVKAGRAVFFLGNPEEVPAWPMDIPIPALVVWYDEETGLPRPAVVIQAERGETSTFIGIRFFDGGNGLSDQTSLEFIDEHDSRLGDVRRDHA